MKQIMNDINDFLSGNKMPEFYNAYNWGNDNSGIICL